MKIFAAFPSKYLKAADLHDKHIKVVMSHVMLEELVNKDGTELCPILYFKGVPKGMVLNKTNAKAIAQVYTDETEAWAGMPIVLFPAMVAFGAETVEAIRIKASGYSSGGPSAAERIRAINESPHKETLGEHMLEQTLDRPMNAAAWTTPDTSEAAMARAKEIWATKKPTPRPKVTLAQDVIWDETAERPMTPAERTELLTEQLKESLARANAALDERREARGATKPDDDGLGIPTFLQRPRPSPGGGQAAEPAYGPNSWIEHMQAAQ